MKTFLQFVVMLGAVIVGAGMLSTPAAIAAEKRPNILFIMTDQQPVSTIGAYGNRLVKTPNIDRLAREGMRFDQFHIAAFACSPSRASYWTGRWSHRHGIVTNDIVLRDDIPTLGSVTHAAGYQTAFVGKWHLGGEMYVRGDKDKWSHCRVENAQDFVYDKSGPWRGGEDEPQCGFVDKWVGGWKQYHEYLQREGQGELLQGKRRVGNHNMAPSGPDSTHIYSQVSAAHHEVAFFATEAEKFIRRERDRSKPFCMVLSTYGPHHPVAPPKPWDTMYDPKSIPLPENFRDDLSGKPGSQKNNTTCWRAGEWTDDQFRDYLARYYGYCSYIDDQVGRVLRALEDEHLMENTIVVYTTDHGDMNASHGFVFKLGSGYDELMRVPFIIRYPAAVRAAAQTSALVQSIDVLPTLLDLSGVTVPSHVDGRSFRQLLDGNAQDFRDHVVTVTQGTIMVASRDWKLVYSCIRNAEPFVELYDRHQRPTEVVNRAGDPACSETLQNMKKSLVTWLRQTEYPYASVIEQRLSKARTRMPSDAEMLLPRVASFKQTQDDKGKSVAEFMIEWNVGEAIPAPAQGDKPKYWTFIQVLGSGGKVILSRATLWTDPPATAWRAGTKQMVGPMRVPVLPNMVGEFPVRCGLYAPDSKTRPKVEGDATRIVGTLKIRKADGGKVTAAFDEAK